MPYLYFGGRNSDYENGRTKIGITKNLLKRADGYRTGSSPDDGFSYWLIISLDNAEEWETYFLNYFDQIDLKKKSINYFSGKEFRKNVDLNIVKEKLKKYPIYEKEGIENLLIDQEKKKEKKELNDLLKLFKMEKFNIFQEEALKLSNERGIFRLPTGTGKHLLGLSLIVKRKPQKVIWFSPYIDIFENQFEKFKIFCQYFGIKLIIGYGSNVKKEKFNGSGKILILANREHMIEEIEGIENIDMIIYDEVQYLPSSVFGEVMTRVSPKTKYFYGLSATPYTSMRGMNKLKELDLNIVQNRNFLDASEHSLVPKVNLMIDENTNIWDKIILRISEWKLAGFWRWGLYLSSIEEVDKFYRQHHKNEHLKLYFSHSENICSDFPNCNLKPNENELFIYCNRGRIGVDIQSLAGVFINRKSLCAPHLLVQILGRPRKEPGKEISFFTIFLNETEDEYDFWTRLIKGIYEDEEDFDDYTFDGTKLYDLVEKKGGIGKFIEIFDVKSIHSKSKYTNEEFIKKIIKGCSKANWKRTLKMVRSCNFRDPEGYKKKCSEYNFEENPDEYYKEKWKNWYHYLHYEKDVKIKYEDVVKFIHQNKISGEVDYMKRKPADYPSYYDIILGYFGEKTSSFQDLIQNNEEERRGYD